jgi:hypothetical protein
MIYPGFPGRKGNKVFFALLHLVLHAVIPGITAILVFPKIWLQAWLLMALAIVIDLDHLLASPVYDPGRCSINFHPLHSYPAIGAYFLLLLIPKLRIFGVGLLLHTGLDFIDCIV